MDDLTLLLYYLYNLIYLILAYLFKKSGIPTLTYIEYPSILSDTLLVRMYAVLFCIASKWAKELKEYWAGTWLADNPISEKRTSRSVMDLGHWFEACWIPDCSADFGTASRIMIFVRISRRPTIYTGPLKYWNSDKERNEESWIKSADGFALFRDFFASWKQDRLILWKPVSRIRKYLE